MEAERHQLRRLRELVTEALTIADADGDTLIAVHLEVALSVINERINAIN